MQRKYISAVVPLDDYVLRVDFVSGSKVLFDMSSIIDSIRFRPLKKPEVWKAAETNGIFVRFGPVEISHDEILEMDERPKTEGNYEN